MATNLLWGFSHKNPQSAGKGEEPSRHNKFVVIHKQTQNTLLYSSLKDIKIDDALGVHGSPYKKFMTTKLFIHKLYMDTLLTTQ